MVMQLELHWDFFLLFLKVKPTELEVFSKKPAALEGYLVSYALCGLSSREVVSVL